jgi:hypothetical protein
MACSIYTGPPTTAWPRTAFPSYLFRGFSSRQLQDAVLAWNYFELVESTDAATRVRLSTQGWVPPTGMLEGSSIWFPIASEGRKDLYFRGKLLHVQACPGMDWRPQRSLGIPPAPLTSVLPETCPVGVSGERINEFDVRGLDLPEGNSSMVGTNPPSSRESVAGDEH